MEDVPPFYRARVVHGGRQQQVVAAGDLQTCVLSMPTYGEGAEANCWWHAEQNRKRKQLGTTCPGRVKKRRTAVQGEQLCMRNEDIHAGARGRVGVQKSGASLITGTGFRGWCTGWSWSEQKEKKNRWKLNTWAGRWSCSMFFWVSDVQEDSPEHADSVMPSCLHVGARGEEKGANWVGFWWAAACYWALRWGLFGWAFILQKWARNEPKLGLIEFGPWAHNENRKQKD